MMALFGASPLFDGLLVKKPGWNIASTVEHANDINALRDFVEN
jgi:hypothetical protein